MRIAYASLSAFKAKANLLASLQGLKHRQGQELLAKVSGYLNYHEVTNSDLSSGTIPSVAQAAAQLHQSIPALDAQQAVVLATALGLHNLLPQNGRTVLAVDEAASSHPWDMEAVLSVPTVEIARFLKYERVLRNSSSTYRIYADEFSPSEFAAWFHCTAHETRDLLNGYAEAGLMSCVTSAQGERWSITGEGAVVFNLFTWDRQSPRWTKSQIAGVQAQVAGLTSESGVREVCIGGRPAFGEGNGTLIIGVCLDHEPYTLPRDREMLESLLSLPPVGVAKSVLLYRDYIPERLRRRLVVAGTDLRDVIAEPQTIDIGEQMHRSVLMRIKPASFDRAVQSHWDGQPSNYSAVGSYFEREMNLRELPLVGKCAARELVKSPAEAFVAKQSDPLYQFDLALQRVDVARPGSDRMYGRKLSRASSRDSLLAEAEYALSNGQFSSFCNDLDRNKLRLIGEYRTLEGEYLETKLLAAVQANWEARARAREIERAEVERKKANKSLPVIRYYAAFDCLNQAKPRLAGFVRQPTTHRGFMNALEGSWDAVCHRRQADQKGQKGAGLLLSRANFNHGALAMFYRPATSDEIEAFDEVGRKVGATLKYLVLDENGVWQAVRLQKSYGQGEAVCLPPILEKAAPPNPVIPKLLVTRQRLHSDSLFDVIAKLPQRHRALANERLINASTIEMSDFAARAANSSSADPLILAAGVGGWNFETTSIGWMAKLESKGWSVLLVERTGNLSLVLDAGGASFTQQLSPYTPNNEQGAVSWGEAYQGKLSSLLHFLEGMQWLATGEVTFKDEGPRIASPIERLVRDVNWALQGDFIDFDAGDGTRWPHIEFRDVNGAHRV